MASVSFAKRSLPSVGWGNDDSVVEAGRPAFGERASVLRRLPIRPPVEQAG